MARLTRRWLIGVLIAGGIVAFCTALFLETRVPQLDAAAWRVSYPLEAEQLLGQTVWLQDARRPGRIVFYPRVKALYAASEQITVHVRAASDQLDDLAVLHVPFTAFLFKDKLVIPLERLLPSGVQAGPRSLYILFQTGAAPGLVTFLGADRSGRPGDFRIDGKLMPGGLAYTLYAAPILADYRPTLGLTLRRWGELLLILLFLAGFGALTLGAVQQQPQLPAGAFPTLGGLTWALVSGAAAVALFSHAASWLGLALTPGLYLAFAGALLVIALLRGRFHLKTMVITSFRAGAEVKTRWRVSWADLAGLLIFLLAAWVALLPLGPLEVPPGADAWFHYRLLRDIGDLARIGRDVNYPTGFHALANAVRLFLPLPDAELLLLTGRAGGLLAGLSLALLARALYQDALSWLAVLVLALFFQPLLGDLFAWGRYPFLYGLALLPAGLLASVLSLRSRDPLQSRGTLRSWDTLPLAALLVLGMAMFHYGSVLLWAALLAAFLLTSLLLDPRRPLQSELRRRARSLLPVLLLLGGLFVLRLVMLATTGEINPIAGQSLTAAAAEDPGYFLRLSLEHGGWLTGLLALAAVCLRGHTVKPAALAWLLGLAILLGLNWLQVLVLNIVVTNFSNAVFALCFFAPLLAGPLFGASAAVTAPAGGLPPAAKPRLPGWTAAALLLLLTLTGAWAGLGALNPLAITFTSADLQTVRWAQRQPLAGRSLLVFIPKNSDPAQDRFPESPGAPGWLRAFLPGPVIRLEYTSQEDLTRQMVIYAQHHPVEAAFITDPIQAQAMRAVAPGCCAQVLTDPVSPAQIWLSQ